MKQWFLWWAQRGAGGQWYGPRLLTDREAWDEEFAVHRGTPGPVQLYRLVWTGTEWRYDTRTAAQLLVPDSRFAAVL
jgi:hypothetical protein